MIPIYKPYLPINCLKYAHEALDSTWISSQGKYISMVTDKLQELLGVKYALPVFNGTVACHLLAKCGADKKKLNTIIVPDNVYVAAYNGFLFDNNWRLISVECDLNTWNYDLTALDRVINVFPDAAVLIVHNVGNIINVPKLKIKYPNTTFIEDNCEGLFGRYNDVYSGTASYVSAISFFGNKNITSGEGGAFLTNDEEAYLYAKCIFSQGQGKKRFIHNELGYNYRMTNVQAAILYGQLELVPEIMEKKHNLFREYRIALKDREDILLQHMEKDTEHACWMFGVRIPSHGGYDKAEEYFKKHDIEIRPMFYPIHAHDYLHGKVSYGNCSNAELLNEECIILPSYPDITREEQRRILNTLDNYVRNK